MAFSSEKQVEEDPFEIVAGPYLQTEFNGAIIINWLTNRKANSWVEYGSLPDQLTSKAYGVAKNGLRSHGRINKVEISNLNPGQCYFYRIVSNEILEFKPYKLTYGKLLKSGVENFVCPDLKKEEVSFLMLNDIHDRPKSIPDLLELEDVKVQDFVFFNGDMFNYQTDEKQIITN